MAALDGPHAWLLLDFLCHNEEKEEEEEEEEEADDMAVLVVLVSSQLPSLMPLTILSLCDTSLVLAFLFLRSLCIRQSLVRVCRARGVLDIGFFVVSSIALAVTLVFALEGKFDNHEGKIYII